MDVKNLLDELRSDFQLDKYSNNGAGSSSSSQEFERVEGRAASLPSLPGREGWYERVKQSFIEGNSQERDDLLFFVKINNYHDLTVEVFRKHSTSLPSPSDGTIIWDQTFFLNLLLHEFEYHVTCATITMDPVTNTIDKTLRKIYQQVYPSPSNRRMDRKSDSEMIYPNIMFCVDNFEEVFNDLCISAPDQKVAVQLMATDKSHSINKLVFLGAVSYSVLLRTCLDKEKTTSSSIIKRLSLSKKTRGVYDVKHPYHFINMVGPSLKGQAEMAVHRKKPSLDSRVAMVMEESRPVVLLAPPIEICVEEKQHPIGCSPVLVPESSPDYSGTSGNVAGYDSENVPSGNHGDDVSMPTSSDVVVTPHPGMVSYSDHSSSSAPPPQDESSSRWKKRFKTLASRSRVSPFSSKESNGYGPAPPVIIATYLTSIELPWYFLLDDIINSTTQPAFH